MSVKEGLQSIKGRITKMLTFEKKESVNGISVDYTMIVLGFFSVVCMLGVVENTFAIFWGAYIGYLLLYKPKYKYLALLGCAGAFLCYSPIFATKFALEAIIMFAAWILIKKFESTTVTLTAFGSSCAVVALVYGYISGPSLYAVFLAFLEGAVCFIFAKSFNDGFEMIFDFTSRMTYSFAQLLGLGVVGSALTCAFYNVEIVNINLGFVCFGVLTLILQFCFDKNSSIIYSVMAGFCIGVICDDPSVLAFLPSVAFFSTFLGEIGKWGGIVGIILSTVFLGKYMSSFAISAPGILDIVIASGIYILLDYLFLRKAVARKKEVSSDASVLGDSICSVVKDEVEKTKSMLITLKSAMGDNTETLLNENKAENVMHIIMSDVCSKCNSFGRCWQNEATLTHKSFMDVISEYEKNPVLTYESLPTSGISGCTKGYFMFKLICYIYDGLKIRSNYSGVINEMKELVRKQMVSLSKVMDRVYLKISGGIETNDDLGERIRSAMLSEGIRVKKSLMLNDFDDCDRVFLVMDNLYSSDEINEKIEPILYDCLGSVYSHQYTKPLKDESYEYSFIETSKHTINVGVKRLSKEAEESCGDSFSVLELPSHKQFIAICDGMGSGEAASKQSSKVLSLLESTLEAGIDVDAAVEMVNTILMFDNNNEVFATLDAMIIDENNLTASFVKSGACASYIRRGFEITKIEDSSLPIGILKEAGLKKTNIRLKKGDTIYIMSDGFVNLFSANEEWLYEKLRQVDLKSPTRIAQAMFSEAVMEGAGVISDDVSIVVAKVS